MNNFTKDNFLAHYGVQGMHWGIRRYQPYGEGGYDPKKTGKFVGKQQKKEYKLARRTGGKLGYRSVYSRATDYYNKSKTVQERSKELSDIAKKAKDLDIEIEFEQEMKSDIRQKAYKLASDRAVKAARSQDKNFDSLSEKEKDRIIDSFLYNEDFLEKAEKEVGKNNTKVKELRKQRAAAIKEYKEQCSKIADEIIGEYGDKNVMGLSDDKNVTYKELVTYALTKPNTMWMFTQDEMLGRPRV
ncbi:MAG: hypothetical protein J6U54_25560 [Clostridiales bacterium]|nr:hypothetical protein [Clostridiales bacterium]